MKDWLSEAAGLFINKDFIITGDRTVSFNKLNEKANNLVCFLQKNYKVKKGDIAAVLSENNFDFILLIFALWKSEVVPVPINIKLNDHETNNLLKFLKPSFIFTDPGINKNITYHDAKFIEMANDYGIFDKNEIQESRSFTENARDINFDDNYTALILFTSGTSGNSKGVQLSFHNLRTSFNNSNTVLNSNKNDNWIASLPFYHIGGFSIITRALLSGASIIIPASSSSEDLAYSMTMYQPTLLSLVSTQLKRLMEMGIKPSKVLKRVLLGGGYIEDSLLDEAIKEGWPIAKVYGSTETSSLVTYLDCNNNSNKKASGGKPIANNQIFIVNERKVIVPNNTIGEIAIKSESCAKGYYNNPIETGHKFINGIYYSGDSGYVDEEGYLFVDSRMNDLIISGGENINPLEIETALMEYSGIQNAAVFGQEDDEWGQIVSAAIITKTGFNISEEELKNFLLSKISSFKLPKRYYFMNDFPMGPLGKVQKNKLREIIKNY